MDHELVNFLLPMGLIQGWKITSVVIAKLHGIGGKDF
jgi:hypothetical protein